MSSPANFTRDQVVVCWPWRLHFLTVTASHPRGELCHYCRKDVAVPNEAGPLTTICLYCAIDRDLHRAEDSPMGDGAPL